MPEDAVLPRIPLNDLKRVYTQRSEALVAAAGETLASGWWLNGEQVQKFSGSFARYVGVGHCVAVANGTDALELALRALINVRRMTGREVVMVANAGGYSSIACQLVGLKPVFADIDEASQLADLDAVVAALNEQTALVIVTHLYGGAVDVPSLRGNMDAAGYPHLPILEDCAQAHGLKLRGRMVGSFGDIATFSFYPTKNLGAFGDAGAVVSSDDRLAQEVDALRQYGWSSKYTISRPGGRNSRMDELQAAILLTLLPGLDAANLQRVAILDHYADALPEGVKLVRSRHGTVGHLAVLLCEDRDRLRGHLSDHGVATDIHYPVLDVDQPAWQDSNDASARNNLPVSRRSVGRLLTIPCFPGMTKAEINRVCEALAAWRS